MYLKKMCYSDPMMRWVGMMLLFCGTLSHAGEQLVEELQAEQVRELRWSVSAEEWARPRSGERILSMVPVVESVQQWMQRPGYRLVIQYPGGEEGMLWGQELQDWLVSLGVPSTELVAIPGHSRNDEIILFLKQRDL
jgi:hypothetical protein